MRLSNFGIVFIMILIVIIVGVDNKEAVYTALVKQNVKINNAIDSAVDDAMEILVEGSDVKNIKMNKESASKLFYIGLKTNLDVLDDSMLKVHTPVLLVTTEDGFFINYNKFEDGVLKRVWTRKFPYCMRDGDITYQFFTGDSREKIKVILHNNKGIGSSHDDTENVKNEEDNDDGDLPQDDNDGFGNNSNESWDSESNKGNDLTGVDGIEGDGDIEILADGNVLEGDFSKISNLINISTKIKTNFDRIRRDIVTNEIKEKMSYYIQNNNYIAKEFGISYNFFLPNIKDDDWVRSIDDVSLFVLFQGYPYGKERFNRYSVAGARVYKEACYYLGNESGKKYYHRYSCSRLSSHNNAIRDKKECARKGYFSCPVCNP